MKKITLKLTKENLQGLLYSLHSVITMPASYGYTNEDSDKLLLASLTELYYKLNSASDPFAENHKVKISMPQAMAFMVHYKALPENIVSPQSALLIKTIIGTIDQQTPPINKTNG